MGGARLVACKTFVLLHLDLALMLFTRDDIVQGCQCIRVVSYAGPMQCGEERELTRLLKRELLCTVLTQTP